MPSVPELWCLSLRVTCAYVVCVCVINSNLCVVLVPLVASVPGIHHFSQLVVHWKKASLVFVSVWIMAGKDENMNEVHVSDFETTTCILCAVYQNMCMCLCEGCAQYQCMCLREFVCIFYACVCVKVVRLSNVCVCELFVTHWMFCSSSTNLSFLFRYNFATLNSLIWRERSVR